MQTEAALYPCKEKCSRPLQRIEVHCSNLGTYKEMPELCLLCRSLKFAMQSKFREGRPVIGDRASGRVGEDVQFTDKLK